MINKFILILLLSCVVSAQNDTLKEQYSINELREQLDDSFNDSALNNAFVGVFIRSLKTGETIYKKNPDKLFVPASLVKLFTTAAALFILGPKYRYETTIYTDGEINNGVLKGDLIVAGSGDPSISNRFYNGDPTVIFEEWANQLINKGVRKIEGNLYYDDHAFDDIPLGKGWAWDNESYWFAAPSGALSFNDNSIEITISPAELKFPAKYTISPNTSYATIINKAITTEDDTQIEVTRERGSNIIYISGTINYKSEPVVKNIAIAGPAEYFMHVFNETLNANGILTKGKILDYDDTDKFIIKDDMTPLLVHRSVPLYRIINETNKNSNNFYSEQLLKTIGLEVYGYGSAENGLEACRKLFNEIGVNVDNLYLVDGSGLSRYNLVTPRQTVNLLTYLYKSEMSDYFYNSLPIAGFDGTLANRMKKTHAKNNLRAKPGYSPAVSALAGYVKTVSGETLAFSVIINNYLSSSNLVNYIIDNACNKLVNFVRN